MGYYDDKWEKWNMNHSWGESVGITHALLDIANELHNLNKVLRTSNAQKEKDNV